MRTLSRGILAPLALDMQGAERNTVDRLSVRVDRRDRAGDSEAAASS